MRIGVDDMTKPEELEAWARTQNRITNGYIRKRFNVDEEMAQDYYDYLKQAGIVGGMGYVNKERGK
nr:MAG TPA: DNA TRANSLOCASE FTSK-BINDING, CHROMOSOME PARTITION, ATP-BINDING, DNA-BINDING.4A [Caudoviricetes sp.]